VGACPYVEIGHAVEQVDNVRANPQVLKQRRLALRRIDVIGAEVGKQDNYVW
jgi:hypothetical protein